MPTVVVFGGSPARSRDGVVLVVRRDDVGPPPGAGGFEFDAVAEAGRARVGVLHASMMQGKAGPRKAAGRQDVGREGAPARMTHGQGREERIGSPMEEPRLCRAAGYRSSSPCV